MKILVLTPVWKRPEITEAYCLGLLRLKKHNVSALCILSEEDPTYNRKLMEKYNIDYVLHENKLGAKKNYGLREALKRDFDYLMELNSDDIIKDELIETYLDLMEQGVPFIGLGNFAFYNAETGESKHKKTCSTLFGIARAYKKDALKKGSQCVDVVIKETFTTKTDHFKKGTKRAIHPDLVNDKVTVLSKPYYKLWDDSADVGMDNHSERVLEMNSIKAEVVTTKEPLAFDIKSNINIWPYHKMSGESYPTERLFSGLSKQEKDHLYALGTNH